MVIPDWVACGERNPEHSGKYLVVDVTGIDVMDYSVAHCAWNCEDFRTAEFADLYNCNDYVTHWAELPALPEVKA